jgi:hypothetical protein
LAAEAALRRRTSVREQLTFSLLPGKRTATLLSLSLPVAGPVTSPCWPCTTLLPRGRVSLALVKNTFSFIL